MTLSVAEQHRRTEEYNAKVAERNLIMNKMLAICETPKTADEVAGALHCITNSLTRYVTILVRSGYLKTCGIVTNDKGRKRTQYISMKHGFNEGFKTEPHQMIERSPVNPHMRIVNGQDHIKWTKCAPRKQEVRIGSTMGMLS